jgi:hypothetical protein
MSGLDGMQQQLSQLLTTAKAQGYKIEQVVPEELQVHLQEMIELKAAREFINELEGREQGLQAVNASLQQQLQAKQSEIDDQPAESKALQVDLQQAHRSIDYYKKLAEDSQRRAERYQRKLANAVRVQIGADEAAAKIERLQQQVEQQQATISSLQNENLNAAVLFDELRAHDAQIMSTNEAKLAEALSHASTVESESELFSETFTSLIDTLESEHSSAAASLNTKTALLCQQETLCNVLVSEVTPLSRFFTRAYSVLQIYQVLFQTLSDPESSGIASLPPQLDALIADASDDLEQYDGVHAALSGTGGVPEERVRAQLLGLSHSASDMLTSFQFIKHDVHAFLQRVKTEPSAWSALKEKFGMLAGKSKRSSLHW